MARFGISLGSNLGDRQANMTLALKQLHELIEFEDLRVSGLYETAPVGCPEGSPDFLNSVVELKTGLEPLRLLEATQQVEIQLGRPPDHERNTPRPIDLDLLYCEGKTIQSHNLTLPHPRMHERAFVMLPLLELRPDLRPDSEELAYHGQPTTRVSGPEWLELDLGDQFSR